MTDSHRTKPTHTAYAVRDFTRSDGEPDASWSRIGVAFMHRDGWGFDVVLDALPVNGRVVLRTNDHKELQRLVKQGWGAPQASGKTGPGGG